MGSKSKKVEERGRGMEGEKLEKNKGKGRAKKHGQAYRFHR